MGVGTGLYMYDVVVKKFKFAILSPDEFLVAFRWNRLTGRQLRGRCGSSSGIVRSLNKIWEAEDISKTTKVLLYRSLIQVTILHNSGV